jgi:hypothetical protein
VRNLHEETKEVPVEAIRDYNLSLGEQAAASPIVGRSHRIEEKPL